MAQISYNLWSPFPPAARADSRFAASQLETALLCNTVSHWLGASLESALRTSLTPKTGSCCVSRLCPALMRQHQPSLNEATKILLNTFRQRQNGRHFPDDIIKCIFLNENVWIPIKISLKFVPKGPVKNIRPLVQIMAWCQPGDMPLYELILVNLLTNMCITRS